jgi:type I restriction enzyme M protein
VYRLVEKREESDHCWKVLATDILANNCNLDRKNPRAKEDITHLPPEQVAESIRQKEQRIAQIVTNIKDLLSKHEA